MTLSRSDKVKQIKLLEEKKRRLDKIRHILQYETLYDWQLKFNASTKENRACMLMAANQVGKTRTGVTIDAFHLTGDYPDDWNGHKFEKPPLIWLLGFSGEKTRDLLQSPLFGRVQNGVLEGGLISADRIIDHKSMTGTSGAMREVRVKHKQGGIATCQFWSYSQGAHALMGDVVDWYHIDEEPRDKNIAPQVWTRTANGDSGNGGRGILTFTPENGRTDLVIKFMDDPSKDQYMQQASWDEAYHMTEATKESLLEQYPEWQRDMRTKGIPLLGHGLIYDIGNKEITCEPFECPPHYYVINGMDFGLDHPQAHVQLWWDKDEDCIYVARAWKKAGALPEVAWGAVKSWAENVPTAWPHDGLMREKGSGRQQKDYYEDAGWDMLEVQAQWIDGGNGVEAGLVEIIRLMRLGKFKVFNTLGDWFDEKMSYHRDDNSKIVKVKDDLLDATRYAYMMRRFAIQKYEISDADDYSYDDEYQEQDSITGY